MSTLTDSQVWQDLISHQQTMQNVSLRALFQADSQRFDRYSMQSSRLLLDYSKNHLTQETLNLFEKLAKHVDVTGWRDKMFAGEILNHTEQRAALHTALRNCSQTPVYVNGEDVMPDINDVLAQMRRFSRRIHKGEWLGYSGKPVDTIINIGIGGSDLGPKMVVDALAAYQQPNIRSMFVSNIDAMQIDSVLEWVNPETSLFIIASKTFTTQETLSNAHTARDWFLSHCPDKNMIKKHFVAVSTNHAKVTEFGIAPENMFVFWDWVGGRFSLWSAIGLSIILAIGMDEFDSLLAGAHVMDQHFQDAPLLKNMPVLLAFISIWYNNFHRTGNHAILPYDYALRYFPAYLQQLEMESNGKSVDRDGQFVDYDTAPVIWGAPGNNGQHAFYQLLHQGTRRVSIDFIIAAQNSSPTTDHQAAVLANALAQSRALMWGRDQAETQQANPNAEASIINSALFPGNQASNTILYDRLNPSTLGELLALYEHKVFVQSVCWHINPFDQNGVELGKQMATGLLPAFESEQGVPSCDASTQGLLKYIRNMYETK